MKLKRFLVLLLAVVLVVGATTIPASAVNNTDVEFRIIIPVAGVNASNGIAARVKEDYSASYVNYKKCLDGTDAYGPLYIEIQIWGGDTQKGPFYDCSSYTYNGLPRTKAIVTLGSYGLVRNDVAERFGLDSYGQIYGKKTDNGATGWAYGHWSVDSINYGYNYYNDLA